MCMSVYVLSLYVHVMCFYICMYWVCNLTLLVEGLVHSKCQIWSTYEGLKSILAQAALDHKDSESEKCKIKTHLICY